MNLQVSGVSDRDGKKVAYVLFTDGEKTAEGIIPDCEILRSSGFSEAEEKNLKEYMEENLAMLKRTASGVNPFTAMMKD